MSRRVPLAALVGLALAAPAPAYADTGARLAETAGGRFPDRAYALTLPAPRSLAAEDVTVRENGRPVDGMSVLAATGAGAHRFGVVLAIDVSTSMRGRPLRGAVSAAKAFVRHRAEGQPVAVITFAGPVQVVQPFTTDTLALEQALDRVGLAGGGTHLLDAANRAVELIRAARITSGSVVLLSDGRDNGSQAALGQVTAAATAAKVRVFSIGLRSATGDFGDLNLLAAGTHGEFSSAASVRDLTRVYERLGSLLASQYLVTYRSTAAPGEHVRVDVRVAGLKGVASAVYVSPALRNANRAPFKRTPGELLWQSPLAGLIAAAIAAGLMGLALWLVLRPSGRTMRDRMVAYLGPTPEAEAPRTGSLSNRVLSGAERSLDRAPRWAQFKELLDVGQITIAPVRLVAWIVLSTLLLLVLLSAIGGPVVGVLALGVPVGAWTAISRRVKHQRRLFAEQLPDNLQVIASAMRAGHSFSGALSVVVDDAPEPTRRELHRVIADERLGVSADAALQVVVRRMASKDLEQVALVAALQRETGGNTAEVLDRVVETVRERLALRRLVKTLTAQGRMSRWIVSALPVGLLAFISLVNPSYVRPLYTTPTGHVLLVGAAVMVTAGSLVIKRIVDIKV